MKLALFASVLFSSAMVFVPVNAANWSTTETDDVFTNKKTAIMIGGLYETMSIYVSCDAERNNVLSLITKSEDEIKTDIAGKALIKVGTNEPMSFDVVTYNHNDDYSGFKAKDASEAVANLVKAIATAKGKILAGIQIESADYKFSEEYSSSGSTVAANSFIKACEIK